MCRINFKEKLKEEHCQGAASPVRPGEFACADHALRLTINQAKTAKSSGSRLSVCGNFLMAAVDWPGVKTWPAALWAARGTIN
jgi:hypothetical protein